MFFFPLSSWSDDDVVMMLTRGGRLYSVGNTLGISGDTIRMIERRAREDKWIFWTGVVVFLLFCWLCVHFLR